MYIMYYIHYYKRNIKIKVHFLIINFGGLNKK